jgi:roadblock/LC7 domain-containing protein
MKEGVAGCALLLNEVSSHMNEEIQKELLAILRAMKDGAPDAWSVLVDQRASYCLTLGVARALYAVMAAIVFAVAVKWTKAVFSKTYDGLGCPDPVVMGPAFLALGAAVAFCVNLGFATDNFSEAFAPLGRVLEMLR